MKKVKLHVTLPDYKKRIFRKIEVTDDIDLMSFCEHIIRSFNGDLSHLYELKGKTFEFDYSGYEYELYFNNFKYANANKRINFLGFSKADKLKLTYDFGDNWEFLITISSIEEVELKEKTPIFKVVGGKGLGIVEDGAGMWGLARIVNSTDKCKENNRIPNIDIDEFDLKKQDKYTINRN